jgi:hypothetical protein
MRDPEKIYPGSRGQKSTGLGSGSATVCYFWRPESDNWKLASLDTSSLLTIEMIGKSFVWVLYRDSPTRFLNFNLFINGLLPTLLFGIRRLIKFDFEFEENDRLYFII